MLEPAELVSQEPAIQVCDPVTRLAAAQLITSLRQFRVAEAALAHRVGGDLGCLLSAVEQIASTSGATTSESDIDAVLDSISRHAGMTTTPQRRGY